MNNIDGLKLTFTSWDAYHNIEKQITDHFTIFDVLGDCPKVITLYKLLETFRATTDCNSYHDFWKDGTIDDTFKMHYDKETMDEAICNRKYSMSELGEILIILEFPEPKSCKGDKVMYKKVELKKEDIDSLECIPIPCLFTPAPVKVQSIETYNDRVLIVRFSDGTFSKAMCEEDGAFDFSMLFTIAYMKRMLGVGKAGHKAYHKLIDEAHKIVKKQAKDKAKAEEEAARKRDIRAKRKKRAEKKAQNKMDKMAEAIHKGVSAAFDDRKRDMAVQEDDLK